MEKMGYEPMTRPEKLMPTYRLFPRPEPGQDPGWRYSYRYMERIVDLSDQWLIGMQEVDEVLAVMETIDNEDANHD